MGWLRLRGVSRVTIPILPLPAQAERGADAGEAQRQRKHRAPKGGRSTLPCCASCANGSI